jgi:hypothetical protein
MREDWNVAEKLGLWKMKRGCLAFAIIPVFHHSILP